MSDPNVLTNFAEQHARPRRQKASWKAEKDIAENAVQLCRWKRWRQERRGALLNGLHRVERERW
jgi:hypothetical protein